MSSFLCSAGSSLLLLVLLSSFTNSSGTDLAGQKISWRKSRTNINCATDPKYLCGRVKSVHDGDSLRIIPETDGTTTASSKFSIPVRLLAIDAPELSQAHGLVSRNALANSLPRGSRVCVISPGRDHYRRVLGFVCLADEEISYKMLAEGHAWCYHNVCSPQYAAAADAARVAGLGLWAPGQTPIAPWIYRRFERRRGKKRRQPQKKMDGVEASQR